MKLHGNAALSLNARRRMVRIENRELLADVRTSLTRHSRILMRCLRTGSNPAPEDFEFVRSNAADRAAREIPLADYLHAFRVFHRIAMDAILRESRHQAGGEPALDAARGLLEYADLATTYASDGICRRNSCCSADNDRIRRDLLEDLLAGREPDGGSRLAAANAAGLTQKGSPCVLIAAVPVEPLDDANALRHAASSTARGPRRRRAARRDPAARDRDRACTRHGYREAYVAVQSIRPEGGVVCLEDLNPFEYLALQVTPPPRGWCRRRSRTSWPRTPARAAP
jgi:hypothetical protein